MVRPLTLIVLLAAAACGGSGPVIDDLQMPETAHSAADGYYSVEGLLSFHDDSGIVNKIRIFIPAVGQTYEFDAAGSLSHGTLPLVVKFSTQSPRGSMEYDVSLVDAGGQASTPRPAFVNLQ